jgi:hypothetical protein
MVGRRCVLSLVPERSPIRISKLLVVAGGFGLFIGTVVQPVHQGGAVFA